MTLDEAIKHCEEIVMDKTNLAQILWDSKEKARCKECADEHNQLAQWLIELKILRNNNVLDKIRAEIKGLSPEPTIYDIVDRNQKKDAVWETVNDVLQIIDKYKERDE